MTHFKQLTFALLTGFILTAAVAPLSHAAEMMTTDGMTVHGTMMKDGMTMMMKDGTMVKKDGMMMHKDGSMMSKDEMMMKKEDMMKMDKMGMKKDGMNHDDAMMKDNVNK